LFSISATRAPQAPANREGHRSLSFPLRVTCSNFQRLTGRVEDTMLGEGIHTTELLLLLLVIFTALLALAAQRFKVPYPIFLVIGGLALSLIPIFPNISLNPTVVFLVILPPLLYSSALQTSWREFRVNLLHILLLAFGGVLITVIGVAVGIHLLLPDYTLATGAVLGSVLGATDAIAASAIGRRVGLPPAMLDLIEGESLMNDAAGLLALQFTVEIVTSRTVPSFWGGSFEFLFLIVGGLGAGLVVGKLVSLFQRPVQGSALQTLSSLATPYLAYLLAESVHGSGVLATVVCGLYLGRKSSQTLTSEARLQGYAVWDTIEFGLNGVVFILIGLQLPDVLNGVRPLHWGQLIGGAAFICALLLFLRFLWIFPAERLARWVRARRLHHRLEAANPKETLVVGWAGMRGVLTLAAALSLPVTADNGAAFPHRAGILFLAFSAILVSLTGQGLSLPWVINKLGVCASKRTLEEERWARRQLVTAALELLQNVRASSESENTVAAELAERYYRQRLEAIRENDSEGRITASLQLKQYVALSSRLRSTERDVLDHLEQEGRIGGETYRRLQRELDLLDLRFPTS
jgi:Na+/H+ antiporter